MLSTEKKIKTLSDIIPQLGDKFTKNLNASISDDPSGLVRIDLKVRAFPVMADILRKTYEGSTTRIETLCILDELFTDVVCSLYLAACALDRPSEMLLRKVLELGIAFPYLWDMPHVFWGWKQHDKDLRFTEMLDHLDSIEYVTYVKRENPHFTKGRLVDAARLKVLYGDLSDSVHGKINTFETLVNDRFDFVKDEWLKHVAETEEIVDSLLRAYTERFPGLYEEVQKQLPGLARYEDR